MKEGSRYGSHDSGFGAGALGVRYERRESSVSEWDSIVGYRPARAFRFIPRNRFSFSAILCSRPRSTGL